VKPAALALLAALVFAGGALSGAGRRPAPVPVAPVSLRPAPVTATPAPAPAPALAAVRLVPRPVRTYPPAPAGVPAPPGKQRHDPCPGHGRHKGHGCPGPAGRAR